MLLLDGEKGSIAIQKNEVVECDSQKNLKIVDLTGAGDLFAAGFLHGYVNNLSIKEESPKRNRNGFKNYSKNRCKIKLNNNYFFLLLKLPLPFFGLTILFLYLGVNKISGNKIS